MIGFQRQKKVPIKGDVLFSIFYGESVTDIFLLKNSATPPRAVALRLSTLSKRKYFCVLK